RGAGLLLDAVVVGHHATDGRGRAVEPAGPLRQLAGVAPPRVVPRAIGAVVIEHARDVDRAAQVLEARLLADVIHAPVAEDGLVVVRGQAAHRHLGRIGAEAQAAVVEVEGTVDAALLDLAVLARVPDALD